MKPTRLNRALDYYRHHRSRVVHRKRNLIKHLRWHVKRNQMGRLAKAKIHCSCRMCSAKTRTLGYPKNERVMIDEQLGQLEEL